MSLRTLDPGRAALPPGRRRRRSALVLFLAAASAAGGAPAAQAAADPGIDLHVQQLRDGGHAAVGYFRLPARPGRAVRAGRLVLSNPQRRAVRVVLDPVNAQTADKLGFGYALRSERPRGPATWTRLSARRLRLAPGETRDVDVTAAVPAGARPGDHLSGISVQTLGQRTRVDRRRPMSVGSTQRYAVGLMLTVPGPRRADVRLTGASVRRRPAGLTFLLSGRNAGTALLTGVRGSVEISDGRRTVLRQPLGPGTFVTDTAIQYPVVAPGERPSAGTRYRVRATLRYAGGVARLDEMVVFGRRDAVLQEQFGGPAAGSGTPAWVIMAAVLAAALALAGFAAMRVRRGRRRPRPVSATVSLIGERASKAAPDRPFSVVVLDLPALAPEHRREAEALMRVAQRPCDDLGILPNGRMVAICPDLGADGAQATERELARRLGQRFAVESARLVSSATVVAPCEAAAVLALPGAEARPEAAWA